MLNDIAHQPPATHALRPEKQDARPGLTEKVISFVWGGIQRRVRSRAVHLTRIVPEVAQQADGLEQFSDSALKDEAARVGLLLRRDGFTIELVARTFALIREAAGRTVGKRHFETQLMGGWALLNGMIAEMETGEGKTLTATLAAGTAALAGVPVHVLTVNDYLTRRDADEMGAVYRLLGLSVGCITHEVPIYLRRAEYLCDITYATNKEIVFDYLRDKLTLQQTGGGSLRLEAESLYRKDPHHTRLLLRGLHYAITDEADSLLIDESRTPLIISGEVVGKDEVSFMRAVMSFADTLVDGEDFILDQHSRKITLTNRGDARLQELVLPPDTPWTGSIRRGEMVRRALSARHLFERDREYLVRDGKVQIIDAFTGRVMPDRSWEQGLQQLIEIKECCEVTRQQETVAKISYQRFFRRYRHLAGMTGTAREVVGEFWDVYGLPVVRIHTNRPLRRKELPSSIFASQQERDLCLLRRILERYAAGQPILIGTASVAASEQISRMLEANNVPHNVLNAKNDADEAEIVALAGLPNAVTIATSMAGRGTDIKLGAGVAELGGLHVILTELHEAARVDRQLAGRCARQGDPGSYEAIIALDSAVLEERRGGIAGFLARTLPIHHTAWQAVAIRAARSLQQSTEQLHARIRRDLFRQDMQHKNLMSFSRRTE